MTEIQTLFDISAQQYYNRHMDREIVEQLMRLSDEEKAILNGQKNIRKDDYTLSDSFIVNSKKMLNADKQMDFRLHTRFIDFPEHGHDYMEFMYVYKGKITHVIDGEKIVLDAGDILFLNRHVRHSVLRAEREDLGINFMVSDAFLEYIFHNVQDNPVMSGFLKRNFDRAGEGEYLHFRIKDNFPVRNLMDNLIYALAKHAAGDYAILTQLVSLLFSYLSFYRETLAGGVSVSSPDALLKQNVSAYIERQYPRAKLSELAFSLGYTPEYLSRRIAELFGATFQQLLVGERLKVARRLLVSTRLSVDEIIRTVGYENQSYFHRLFREKYGDTPRRYRMKNFSPKQERE